MGHYLKTLSGHRRVQELSSVGEALLAGSFCDGRFHWPSRCFTLLNNVCAVARSRSSPISDNALSIPL